MKAMWYRGNGLHILIDYVVTANDAPGGKNWAKTSPGYVPME